MKDLNASINNQLDSVKTGKPIVKKKVEEKKPVEAKVEKPKPKSKLKEWETFRIRQLRTYAKKLGIKRWNTMPRRGLVSAIKHREAKK